MLGNAFGCAVLALVGLWAAFQPGWHFQLRLIGGLLGVTLPFVSIALGLRIKSGLAALRFDRNTLEIATFYRSTSRRWSDVRAISREKLTQSSAFGLVKQDLAHYLVIETATEDGSIETYRIQEDLLDWPKDRRTALAEQLIATWQTPSAARAPAPASAPPVTLNGVPVRAGGPVGFGRRGL